MDTLTHVLAGVLVGETFFRGKLGRWAPLVGGVAAALPDADILIGWLSGDPFLGLRTHRGFTHSLLFVPVAGLVLAAIFSLFAKDRRFLWLFLAAMAGTLCQPLLDWTTNFGTQLLWPFRDTRFALDWIFIIDPYLAAILAVSLIIFWRHLKKGAPDAQWMAVRGLIFALGYVLFLGALHQTAMQRLGREMVQLGVQSEEVPQGQIACLPVPLSPFSWNAIYTTGNPTTGVRTHVGLIRALSQGTVGFDTIKSSPETKAVRAVQDTPEGRTYLWFARFPVIEERALDSSGTKVEVEIYDARFRSYVPLVGWSLGRPFLVRAEVDHGQVGPVTLSH